MSKSILPRNVEGILQGYCEERTGSGELVWKGVCYNNKWHGYIECYNYDGSIDDRYTGYHLNSEWSSYNNEEGYCIIWNRVIL